jgi:histidyl-tRNA synthetase
LKLFSEIVFIEANFEEVLFPSIWEDETFVNKVGPENTQMMWRFKDKKDRSVCLVPEITGMAQEMWRNEWSKQRKTYDIFYVQKCYRYEKPQAGRYREFTQLGIEMLGSKDIDKSIFLLETFLNKLNIKYDLNKSVSRGLSYYVANGFEASVSTLGAQKQIAGGGLYAEGVGWAVGLDRLMLIGD